jgi:hypothetical protein
MPRWLSAVHRQAVSTLGCPPNPARRPGSRCPAVRCPGVQSSGVQPVQCPAIWVPRPDAAVQPTRVQPVRRPAVWCPPVSASSASFSARLPGHSRLVPPQPGAGDRETSGRRGSGLDWIESSSMWSGPVPGGWVDGPRSMVAGTAAEVVCGPAGSVGRGPGPGGASAGGCTRPTRQARPPPGAPSLATALGQGWLARCCAWHRAGRPSGLEPRPRCVVIAEPDGRVDEPGRRIRARRRGRRAAPARPSQVASATGSTLATL